MKRTPVRYAKSGDLSIAYQVYGDGPLNLVIVPGFISNIDQMPDTYQFGPLFERLASFSRCVIFDKRGTGLSDRELGFGSIEERSDDIRAVMDDVGFESASLFGYSEGGPLSIVFAASHPARVEALAIYGSFAWTDPKYDRGGVTVWSDFKRFTAEVEHGWGSGYGLRPFIEGVPDTESVTEALARYERSASSPRMAGEILRAAGRIDARPLLNSVSARTLVLHSTGDPIIPVMAGRKIAEGIPGAEFIEHDVAYHWPWDGGQAWFLDPVEEFLTGEPARQSATDRFLSTVLFTDIVGSTGIAAREGDRHWRRLLDGHDHAAVEEIDHHGGELIKTTGDGLLAIFDSPSRAVEGALAIREAVQHLGLQIRAGVHTGEVERRDSDLGGIGVHIGARVMDKAGAGEVFVSRTVRDLTTGSGLEFDDRGSYELKGVPGDWELYSLAKSTTTAL